MPECCEAKSHLRGANNREENTPAAIFREESSLGRNRMLCRGEFGAAVFEKRRSIRFRRAETIEVPG